MTTPRRGSGEHVAEVVLACVLFAYAGLSGLVLSWGWFAPGVCLRLLGGLSR